MTRSVRIRLILFAVIGALAIGVSGVRYAKIDRHFDDRSFTVTVDLAGSGGLYAGSEVTERGIHVGHVADVRLSPDGVVAVLDIDDGHQIPTDVTASVHTRSAVGEQYIDLYPRSVSGPWLADGDEIPRADTSTPLPVETLLGNIDSLVGSVDTDDLRTVVSQLGQGFAGTGPDLQRLIDGSNTLVQQARANVGPTISLTRKARTVLATQAGDASSIRGFARSLNQLSGTVRDRDPALRRIIADGAPLAHDLGALITALVPLVPPFLSNLTALSMLTGRHLPALEQALVAFPYSLATATNSVRRGRAQFSLAVTPLPTSCQKGYIRPSQWRSTQDLSHAAPVPGLHCAEPGKVYRGTNYAPR